MPQVIEIPVDLTAFAANSNRSPLIAVNSRQRATVVVKTSAGLSAGKWALKSTIDPDTSIAGALVAETAVVANARMHRASADVADKWVYVEQTEAPTGGTVQAITVFVR